MKKATNALFWAVRGDGRAGMNCWLELSGLRNYPVSTIEMVVGPAQRDALRYSA